MAIDNSFANFGFFLGGSSSEDSLNSNSDSDLLLSSASDMDSDSTSDVGSDSLSASDLSSVSSPGRSSLVQPDPYAYAGGEGLVTCYTRSCSAVAYRPAPIRLQLFCVAMVTRGRNNRALSFNIARLLACYWDA